MRKLSSRAIKTLKSVPSIIRARFKAIVSPLTPRERLVYSGIILVVISLLVAPRITATVGDVGSIFSVAATECVSTDSWISPHNIAGQPSVSYPGIRSDINRDNSASWTGDPGSIVCGKFSPIEGHNRTDNAISVTMKILNQESTSTNAETVQAVAKLQDGEILNERISLRPDLTEPNLLDETSKQVDLDGLIQISVSNDSGSTWLPLHLFRQDLKSAEVIRYEIALPDKFITQPTQLAIRAETVVANHDVTILLDSMVWTYKVGKSNEISAKLVDRERGVSRTESVPILNTPDDLYFEVDIKKPGDGFWQGIQSKTTQALGSDKADDIAITAKLYDQDGQLLKSGDVSSALIRTDTSNKDTWGVDADLLSSSFNPGRYTIELEIDDGEDAIQTITQDFLWGVLAINPDKSSYRPSDNGRFDISVLDERGATVCDAELKLTITGPTNTQNLSTTDGTIRIGELCEVYSNHIDPDYFAEYAYSSIGTYTIQLDAITENGQYTVVESVEVVENPIFEISRVGPTRVFPILDFPMKINIYSRDGYKGKISDVVPASFVIAQDSNLQAYVEKHIIGSDQFIEWEVDISPGQSVTVGYQFDAPDISPEFYQVGPMQVIDGDVTVFDEQRSWQLAGDAVGRMLIFFNGATTPAGWTCVSCTSGDPFFQRFAKGAATYGGTGGGVNHTHTASTNVSPSLSATTELRSGSAISDVAHTHTTTPTLAPPSNIPSFRQLKIIRSNSTGIPASLPAGAVGMFDDASLPSGWTQYSAQNTYFTRGESTVGTTGGNNSHTVSISGSLSTASTANQQDARNPNQASGAVSAHTHTYSASSAPGSNEPPFIEVIMASIASSTSIIPQGLITMWDEDAPTAWINMSGSSDPINGRYIKGSSSYGTTGGALTHNHSNTTFNSLGPTGPTTARSGTAGASSTHVHAINVINYSSPNHEPPYREAVFAKYNPVTTYNQSSFRFFTNTDTTDVGASLAAQDTPISSPAQGTPFRLRMNLHVRVANLATSGQNFKLQYAERSGTCDALFSGESYSDIGTASGGFRYFNNATPADNTALTSNASDPTHSSDTLRKQTYEESNNFSNTQSAVNIGEDGMWDFALVDISASASTSYCIRAVLSDGSTFANYDSIPEFLTPPPPPRMILLYDGATAPAGWTCISCTGGDPAYQRMLRGEATFGSTGGTADHTHSATGSVATTGTAALSEDQGGADVSTPTHTHTYSPAINTVSNLPNYRQLKVIRFDAGTPSTIPTGAIGIKNNTTIPSGFTRYSTQDGSFVYGENTVGTTGGANTHTHSITGATSAANSPTTASPRTTGSTSPDATPTHTHDVSGATVSQDHQPPFIETVLIRASSDQSIPAGMIAMWDDNPGGSWTCVSCTGGDTYYQRFFKPAATHGTTGGGTSHTPPNVVGITSGGANQNFVGRNGSVGDDAAHTHSISATSFSSGSTLPPYINVVFYQAPSSNTAPNSPASLDQQKTNTTSIGTGNWTNETSVLFEASLSDTDNPDTLELCVEVQEVGTGFTGSENDCGTPVAYTGTAVTAELTINSLTDGSLYHWQARTKDGIGAYSSWVSFGANPESSTDFRIDSTPPTGSVYDGTSTGVDFDFNNGSLDTLSANWDIDSSASGLSGYEYSIGSAPGSIDVKAWTSNGTTANFTDGSLTLNTSQPYYVNIRTTDNAGSQSVVTTDGQFVSPTLNFTVSTTSLDLGNLNPGNSFTATDTTTLTTSTNAYNGYVVRAFATGLLSNGAFNIGMFNGGTYVSTDEWLGGDIGYGYTSSDTLIQGANKFLGSPCAGGGNPPCYAPWSLTAPGDIIADHTSTVSGSPIVNEAFTITHRVTADSSQTPGIYTTTIVYNITAKF